MESIAQTENSTTNKHASGLEGQQRNYSRRETILTMVGVLLIMLLASLDQTIVSTAMPHIISELRGFDRYTWVTTAYLLTSTIMVPIYGKLSDMYGRKSIFLAGIILFLTGSALCGMSPSMNALIGFRAFQGLGAAALLPIAMAVVGDLFTPRERGKWQGVTGAVFGLSSVIGPAVGGWITENSNWRWVFYVNLPIGLLALVVLIFLMPSLSGKGKNVSIDYLGATLLIIGTVPLMLGFTWAGSTYSWLSPQVLGLLALAGLALAAFVIVETHKERTDKQPIIDPSLFRNKIFVISVLITMTTNMSLFGSIFFLPLFAQGILGISATNSGLLLSPLMLTLVCSSIVSGQIVSRQGKYKLIAIIGMAISVCGAAMLLRLNIHSNASDLWLAMVVIGFGMGFGVSFYTLIVQNAIPDKIGQSTSALTFFRQIGSTVALAAMGSIMTTTYQPAFHNAIPAATRQALPTHIITIFDNPNILLSPETQSLVSKQFSVLGAQGMATYQLLLNAVKIGLAQGIHNTFILSLSFMLGGLILVFFLEDKPLRGREAVEKKPGQDMAESDSHSSSYTR
ncbi:MDR family MFS transporter [Dictyobacter kobayashii]|uniref:MFS transporter n=1 Tax=Dictyobacter kobayashii TaxID=2014872 RepID=A0A402AX82_9CHLR|nr:MDR family MFS transporter [Dictyobacter kobayashii]GCE23697.1 MFS transporter [Dictyobacter kobayashii]